MSGYIKQLLSTTEIPLIDSISENDILLEGCIYLYDGFIIKCLTSGYFHVNAADTLFPSDKIYPSDFLFPSTGYVGATYKVLTYYDKQNSSRYSYKFSSKYNYYDGDTHFHLGQYLRYLKGMHQIDLMPFYNCNVDKTVDTVRLTKYAVNNQHFVSIPDADYKVIAVPIKFGKVYTIAIDCTSPVLMRGMMWGDSGLVMRPVDGGIEPLSNHSRLEESFISYPAMRFNSPITYSIPMIHDRYLYDRQNYLHLFIQLPATNDSSVVVLEGNYENNAKIKLDDPKNLPNIYNLSLLWVNTHSTIAFSSRLSEYLLSNAICADETISENIARIQDSLVASGYGAYLGKYSTGVWTKSILDASMQLAARHASNQLLLDMGSIVNKDIERLLFKSAGGYGE